MSDTVQPSAEPSALPGRQDLPSQQSTAHAPVAVFRGIPEMHGLLTARWLAGITGMMDVAGDRLDVSVLPEMLASAPVEEVAGRVVRLPAINNGFSLVVGCLFEATSPDMIRVTPDGRRHVAVLRDDGSEESVPDFVGRAWTVLMWSI